MLKLMQKLELDRQFKNIFDHAGIGMGMASLEGKWLRVNSALCEMLGYTEEQLLEKTFIDVTFADDRAADIIARDRMIGDKSQTYQREKRYIHRDGHAIWIQLNVTVLRDEHEVPLSFFSQSQNITDRKIAESKLSESFSALTHALANAKISADTIVELSALINQSRDVIVLLDVDGKVRLWNQGAEKLYGWTSEEAIGRKNTELYASDSESIHEDVSMLIEQGYWEGEVQRKTRNGFTVTVESRATLMKDSNGAARSFLVISTDITDQKKMAETKLRSQRLESIGTLAGGIAHDLNNVLTPITMAIGLLEVGETDQTRLGILETLTSCSKRGAEMIRQVLSFARGIEGERTEVKPGLILRELELIVSDTFLKSVRIESSVAADLWSVSGDATQLQQVFLNLAVNARDAMPSGGKLTLQAENVRMSEQEAIFSNCKPGSYVRITVEDNGSGIPKEILDRVFEPFFTTKEMGKGTGLGLSTSLAIVKSHDGVMKVYSEAGTGTKFIIYLPALQSQIADAPVSPKRDLPNGSGECILIVDDEPMLRSITRQTLETFGYQVREAANGDDAVAIYWEHQNEIAAVLTDMMMPGMDGHALIRALKEINPKVRIIATSGLASHAEDSGANMFLSKPYGAEVILKTLRDCLKG